RLLGTCGRDRGPEHSRERARGRPRPCLGRRNAACAQRTTGHAGADGRGCRTAASALDRADRCHHADPCGTRLRMGSASPAPRRTYRLTRGRRVPPPGHMKRRLVATVVVGAVAVAVVVAVVAFDSQHTARATVAIDPQLVAALPT